MDIAITGSDSRACSIILGYELMPDRNEPTGRIGIIVMRPYQG